MKKRSILNKKESLKHIHGWDFTPDNNNRVKAIVLTMPSMTEPDLHSMTLKYGTRVDVDGDAVPGMPVLRVFSEAMARDLISANISRAVNTYSSIDASVL